jgi:hypothetical protein
MEETSRDTCVGWAGGGGNNFKMYFREIKRKLTEFIRGLRECSNSPVDSINFLTS